MEVAKFHNLGLKCFIFIYIVKSVSGAVIVNNKNNNFRKSIYQGFSDNQNVTTNNHQNNSLIFETKNTSQNQTNPASQSIQIPVGWVIYFDSEQQTLIARPPGLAKEPTENRLLLPIVVSPDVSLQSISKDDTLSQSTTNIPGTFSSTDNTYDRTPTQSFLNTNNNGFSSGVPLQPVIPNFNLNPSNLNNDPNTNITGFIPNVPLQPYIPNFNLNPSNLNSGPVPSINLLKQSRTSESKSSRDIIDFKHDVKDDGSFEFLRRYSNGMDDIERGYFKDVDGEKIFVFEGQYTKLLPNGKKFIVAYISDEKGYIIQTKFETPLAEFPLGFSAPAAGLGGKAFNVLLG